MAEDESTSIELDAEHKTVKITGKKTAEIIAILSLVVLAWVGFVVWQHSGEAKAGNEKLQVGIEQMVQSMQELTCLLGFPEKDRELKADFCKRIAKVR